MWSDASYLYHLQDLVGDRTIEVLRNLQNIIFKEASLAGIGKASGSSSLCDVLALSCKLFYAISITFMCQ